MFVVVLLKHLLSLTTKRGGDDMMIFICLFSIVCATVCFFWFLEEDKLHYLIASMFSLVLFFVFLDAHIDNLDKLKDLKYENGAVVESVNSVGCIKYRYYDDVYYKCKDKNINSVEVEERIGKSVVIQNYPVVD